MERNIFRLLRCKSLKVQKRPKLPKSTEVLHIACAELISLERVMHLGRYSYVMLCVIGRDHDHINVAVGHAALTPAMTSLPKDEQNCWRCSHVP